MMRCVVTDDRDDDKAMSRSDDVICFIKPRRRKKTKTQEPLYQLNMRPRVSIVHRFNSMADRLRLTNSELLELLLDAAEAEKKGNRGPDSCRESSKV